MTTSNAASPAGGEHPANGSAPNEPAQNGLAGPEPGRNGSANVRGDKTVARAFSSAPWEAQVGYCRALRIGAHVWVTGSTAVRADGQVFGRGDPELQARRCLDVIEEALRRVDAAMEHVVRTRMYVTDISHWEAVGAAHRERFCEFPPATSMVEVSGLIHPDMLVEVEAEAYVRGGDC